MRSIPKSHMKHCLISQPHTLLTCFVFSWVVEASAVCFIDCLACVPWWWRGLGAGSSLASFFTALLLCIDDLMTLMILICITACVWCFSIFCCFSAQCCFTAACCIAMTCRCAFSTFTLSNSEGFWCADLTCSCLQQFGLLTEFTCSCMVYVLFSALIAYEYDLDDMLIFLVFFWTLGGYGISLLVSMLLHVSLKCLKALIVFVHGGWFQRHDG